MKILLLSLSFFGTTIGWGQYYYNDIVATAETNQQMRGYLDNRVRTVSAVGFDNKNVRANDFSEFYEIRENGKALKVSGIANMTKKVMYYRYDDQVRVIQMSDTFATVRNFTKFTYDDNGRVTKVENTVMDSTSQFHQLETHAWQYNAAGKPEKMWRVVTNLAQGGVPDSLEVRFITDDDGNIGEERAYRRGVETAYFYYYYDDKNRLTDIVRYNKKLRRLIPDIMFEYDDNDRVIQKITTTSDRVVGYLIWRYIIDEKGLRSMEALFNNDKQLTGKIQYSYTFGN